MTKLYANVLVDKTVNDFKTILEINDTYEITKNKWVSLYHLQMSDVMFEQNYFTIDNRFRVYS